MSVIKPTPITPAMVVSTTATDSTPAWSSATIYAREALVAYQQNIYYSVADGNVAITPAAPDAAQWWLLVGPDNMRAMFDDVISTATTAADSLSVTVAPGINNSLALFGMQGRHVHITVRNGAGGPVVYEHAAELDGSIVNDWYQYFFEPFLQEKELILTDLPPYASAHITMLITGTGTVGVGTMVVGTEYSIGRTLMGVGLSNEDYSRVDIDEFGTVKLTRRNSAKRTTFRTTVPRAELRKVYQILDDLRATPAVWRVSRLATDSPANVFGIRSSWEPVIEHEDMVILSIELKGMT